MHIIVRGVWSSLLIDISMVQFSGQGEAIK